MESIESQFLKEFAKRLIINSAPQDIRDKIINQEKIEFEDKTLKKINIQSTIPISSPKKELQNRPAEIPSQVLTFSAIKKINPLIADPSVLSIECTGPNKPLLVNQRGFVRTANIIFNKEEINSIIDEFSEKTRIPLIEGIFKAYYQNLIITAVVSEYVGTRFIIQKRMPA